MNNFMNGMFGKIAPGMCRLSMSGNGFMKGKKGMNKMMSYMMMSEMMKGGSNSMTGNNSMFPMMMLMNGGGMPNMFEGMFDMDDTDDSDDEFGICETDEEV